MGEDVFDFFELMGLGAGTFTLHASETEGGNTSLTVFSSGGATLNGPSTFTFSGPLNIGSQAIPVDGDLVIGIHAVSGTAYTVIVDTTAAPEHGTLLTAGLGLAGAVALTRKRRQQS